ncbi:CBS domain-containing protein [Alteromonas pelagimontana]|uniref:CBS domain-containing protein n=1 Tax=Alteromonas pelagimontana TaxID=1858656 RepID=A0A6M4MJD6_9ALTE|nr:CBS domain-containing protein [Alteromonas pelagimontana]QJR82710.1 CBS domain-containing protein [Alteromonas pelagimontana]
MSLADIMTTRVVTVHLDDNLATVREIFQSTGFHHLLVVENKKLLGIISDRDLLKALSPFLDEVTERSRDRATLERKAHQIMSRELITLTASSSIVSAIALFNRHAISCIPIIDDKHNPVGIVSWRDIMRYVEQMVKAKRSR